MPEPQESKPIDKETRDILEELRKEMGLDTTHDVIRALAKQALNRAAILCPRCGHHARQTEKDKAECTSCMSTLRLAEGLMVALEHEKKE